MPDPNEDFPIGGNDNEEPEVKSRSQVKREMEALQNVGKKLCDMKPAQLKEVPTSEELNVAIATYHRINSREAKRRQLQFIGKLMRSENMEGIQSAIDRFDTSSKQYAQRLHQLEAWRTKLIEESNTALTEFIAQHPRTDVQKLRQLVRQSKKDIENQKNTGAAKKLFQFLKDLQDE